MLKAGVGSTLLENLIPVSFGDIRVKRSSPEELQDIIKSIDTIPITKLMDVLPKVCLIIKMGTK
jgi:hypothetical protein